MSDKITDEKLIKAVRERVMFESPFIATSLPDDYQDDLPPEEHGYWWIIITDEERDALLRAAGLK